MVRCKEKSKHIVLGMIILEDLVVNRQTDSIVEAIGVDNDEYFKEIPKKCCHCDSVDMKSIEVLGAIDEPILWGCLKCDALYLKFSRSKTEVLLANAMGLWTNSSDWGFVERDLFN